MFTDSERAHLSEMLAIATDEHGQEVLIGLTREETEEYLRLSRKLDSRSREEGQRYSNLRNKHELARFQALGAKDQTRH